MFPGNYRVPIPALLFFFCTCLKASETTKPKGGLQDHSYIGFGYGPVTYMEKTPVMGGYVLKMESTGQNMFVRTGGFVAVTPKLGFYIENLNNSFARTQTESWEVENVGVIQTNDTQIEISQFSLYVAHSLKPRHALLWGLSQNRTAFSRFTFKNGPAVDEFNALRNSPELIQQYRERSEVINQLSDDEIYERYIKMDAVRTDADGRALHVEVTEKFTGVSLLGGYQYSSFFDGNKGLSWSFQALLGMPAYYYVENFSTSSTFDSYFKGYDLHAALGLGMETGWGLSYRAQYDYGLRHRDSIWEINKQGQKVILPENKLSFHRFGVSVLWSF